MSVFFHFVCLNCTRLCFKLYDDARAKRRVEKRERNKSWEEKSVPFVDLSDKKRKYCKIN